MRRVKLFVTILLGAAPVSTNALSKERGDAVPQRWIIPEVSSSMWESHPAIDPRTGDLWFVRSDKTFSGWRMFVSPCGPNGRGRPVPSAVSAAGIEADPFFADDGRTLWFISSRLSGSMNSDGLDIWRAHRAKDGTWQVPERLPEPVNSASVEWFPRPASDGWLYFGSARLGGHGRNDIWRARQATSGRWIVENAGPLINGPGDEFEFQPSTDGRWAMIATDQGLYRVERRGTGWSARRRYSQAINQNRNEIGPTMLGHDGSFAFSRDTDEASGELFHTSGQTRLASHLRCPRKAPK